MLVTFGLLPGKLFDNLDVALGGLEANRTELGLTAHPARITLLAHKRSQALRQETSISLTLYRVLHVNCRSLELCQHGPV